MTVVDGIDVGNAHVDGAHVGVASVGEGVLREVWGHPQTSRPSYVSVVCGGKGPCVRNPVILARGTGGVTPAPVCEGSKGIRNEGSCEGLGLEDTDGGKTRLPGLKGMGNGSF